MNLKFLKRNLPLPCQLPSPEKISQEDYKIWILWWQGEDNMPELVRTAVATVKRATDKEVVFITEANYKDYIEMPDFIYQKVKKGIITMAALSDYIRVSLLDSHGGLWIDSTVFFAQPIPSEVYGVELFSIRNVTKSCQFVANGKWNVQFLGTNVRHNRVFFQMKTIFEEYWKKYSILVDYLLVDYCFEYIYENDEASKMLFDKIPYTNPNMHKLREMLNDVYDEDAYQSLVNGETYLFKLTYKMKLQKQNRGKETFYGHIVNQNLLTNG